MVFRKGPGGPEIALASRRTKKGALAWGLPKGLVETGEEPPQTAVREVEEETGLVAEVRESLGDISYWYVWDGERVRKKVFFFLMEAVGGDVSRHDHEMEEVRWFPLPGAERRASYRGEQDVIKKAAAALGVDL
ncbi:MAG: NUDIX domain-containing protein [Actinomycetota bacterium]|nr:NUDIX domain-containing protein [Actinomycetota bacterium]